jgi:hypothetical protein
MQASIVVVLQVISDRLFPLKLISGVFCYTNHINTGFSSLLLRVYRRKLSFIDFIVCSLIKNFRPTV